MADPVAHLQALVRLATISRPNPSDTDWAPFDALIALLPDLYPATHAVLSRELVMGYSMLYRWRGRTDGPPTVFMAHYDVVPATVEGWTHPPFSAELVGAGDDQLVWGRGTLDNKGSLACILEAVEAQVLAGHELEADLYLSFGHDEETEGSGARAIVELLESRGIRPCLVIDEGGCCRRRHLPRRFRPDRCRRGEREGHSDPDTNGRPAGRSRLDSAEAVCDGSPRHRYRPAEQPALPGRIHPDHE